MNKKLSYLNAYDLLILTVIFLGAPFYSSTIHSIYGDVVPEGIITFDPPHLYAALSMQLAFLMIAITYLQWRKFDWRQLNLSIHWKTPLYAIGIYLVISLFVDVVSLIQNLMLQPHPQTIIFDLAGKVDEAIARLNVETIIYSLFNGFYEELFFLGLFLAVPRKYLVHAIIAGVVIRFSFHTYQGMTTAISIGLMGLPLAWMYLKRPVLVPFFLAHAIADVIGLGGVIFSVVG